MIFVISVEESAAGHTLGFLGLQIFLLLVALENVMLANCRKEDYFRLGHKATKALSWTYYFILAPATIMKIVFTIAFLVKKPLLDIHDPLQVLFIRTLDRIWLVLAAVLPLFFSIYQYKTEPHLKIKIQ
jgi:hypothetical protein